MSKDYVQRGNEMWKLSHHDLQEQLKDAEMRRMQGQRSILRCAVCGRADKPWIAYWVAPYIVAYERF